MNSLVGGGILFLIGLVDLILFFIGEEENFWFGLILLSVGVLLIMFPTFARINMNK